MIQGYRIDNLFIDLENRRLVRDGNPVALNSKYFDVLVYLVKRYNQLTTRNQLFEQVWQDVIVTDTALTQSIKDIRRVLQDDARHPQFIKTVPKHGFIFVKKPVPVYGDMSEAVEGKISKRPWKFLDYFREEDRDIFFGRESEISTICSKIITHQSFVIYGRSGVGKSSLVHAGLLPHLRSMGYDTFVVRSFPDPSKDFMRLMNSVPENEGKELFSAPAVQNHFSRRGTIVFFDQFEEFFTMTPEKVRKNFIHYLQDILKTYAGTLKLVFIIREDLLAELSILKPAFPFIFHHEFRLQRLQREQAFKAIAGPPEKVHCRVESELIDSILNDLLENGFIDPPQLQIVCEAVYDEKKENPCMSLEVYNQLGGARNILSDYLNRVIEHFQGQELHRVKNILLSLISENEQRLVVPLDEIENRLNFPAGHAGDTGHLIGELAHSRIIRFRRQNGGTWIELTHDFLIPAIIRWQTVEIMELKRAHALMNRAMENYLAHQLYIDQETLDLLLSVGEKLTLSEQETALLARSLLYRGRSVPEWLIRRTVDISDLIMEAFGNQQPEVRMAALESAVYIKKNGTEHEIFKMALSDHDLMVRKNASIVFAGKAHPAIEEWFKRKDKNLPGGLINRAISLSFIRDYNKKMIHLRSFPLSLIILVMWGLMWIRIRRQWADIRRKTFGGAAGAGISGLLVGLSLSIILSTFRQITAYESLTLMLVLSSLGALAGFTAGFGVSLGMTSVLAISYRHSPYWGIAGATAGGFIVGGIAHLLGVDILQAIFGQNLSQIAGAYEGAIIGLGLSAGYFLGLTDEKRKKWLTIVLAACGSMLGAILLTIIQGNLFSASLDAVARSFNQSQIDLQPLARLFGEAHFGRLSRLILAAVEGLLFGGFLSAGLNLSKLPFKSGKKNN